MDRNARRDDFKRAIIGTGRVPRCSIIVAAALATVLRCRASRFDHTVALWKVFHVFSLAPVSRELDLPRLREGLLRPIDSGVDGLPKVCRACRKAVGV